MDYEKRIYDENLENYNWKDEKGNVIEKKDLNNYFKNKSQNTMKEAITKYMPIGSVLKVQDKIGLYMIIGYNYKNEGFEFDYIAVKYPGGITNGAKIDVFNHDKIDKIHHIGMVDNIQREYKKSLLGETEGFSKTL